MKALLIGALSLGAIAFASSAWADNHHDHGGSGGGNHESHESHGSGGGGNHESHESHGGGHESHSSEHIGVHVGGHGDGDHHFGHHDSIHVGIGHHAVGHVTVHHGVSVHGHVRLAHYHHVFRAPHRYRIGYWRAPYGFHYRRFGIGERIPGVLLVSAYFLNDYYNYGLEEPDDGFVWVRDGSDAVLVDEDSGEVVEVEYDVFY
jgi:Ni/Co efflux regulator RcnB